MHFKIQVSTQCTLQKTYFKSIVIVIVKLLSHVQLFATPWTVDCQAPLTIGFSRQGYWSGLPFPSSGGLPDPRIKPRSPTLQAGSLPTELHGKPLRMLKAVRK